MLRSCSTAKYGLFAGLGSPKPLRWLRLVGWCALAALVGVVFATIRPIAAQSVQSPTSHPIVVGYLDTLDDLDISGTWAHRLHEDWYDRFPGPDEGDYTGLPLNDAARLRADAWRASIWALPEWQCRPHGAEYRFRSDWPLSVSKVVDPITQQLVAYAAEMLFYGPAVGARSDAAEAADVKLIYMDGRPHPTPDALHTWAGFSTGRWTGNMLTVETTHAKEGYFRRNGVPQSDLMTMTEHWMRNDDILTLATIATDPVYLTEPLVRTTNFELDPTHPVGQPRLCDIVEETSRPKGDVPHHLPGSNSYLKDFANRFRLPFEVTRGGAETLYPDYQLKLAGISRETAFAPLDQRNATLIPNTEMVRSVEAISAPAISPGARQITGSPRIAAPTDLTGEWVSVVTEDWRWRMVTPPKGDYSSIPLNAEGRKATDSWDPARDEAAGQQCRAYGAANVMRMPGRLRITWEDDATLRIDTEAGTQTRRVEFGPAQSREPTWQGHSKGEWHYVGTGTRGGANPARGGSLKVMTTNMRPGYLRRNGVPYSDQAIVTEYFNRAIEDNGDQWLFVTTVIDDPTYLRQRYITSSQFKKIPTGSAWRPTPCQSL